MNIPAVELVVHDISGVRDQKPHAQWKRKVFIAHAILPRYGPPVDACRPGFIVGQVVVECVVNSGKVLVAKHLPRIVVKLLLNVEWPLAQKIPIFVDGSNANLRMPLRGVTGFKQCLRKRPARGLLKACSECAPGKLASIGRCRRHRNPGVAKLVQRSAIEGHVAILIHRFMYPVRIGIAEEVERFEPGGGHSKCGVTGEARPLVKLN